MLNYIDYTFETKLEIAFSNINESIKESLNINILKNLIPEKSEFWTHYNKLINNIPNNIKKIIINLINKSLPFLKNITIAQANILLNKLFRIVYSSIKDFKIRKQIIILLILFITTTTALNIENVAVADVLYKTDVTDVINTMKKKDINKIDIKLPDFKIKYKKTYKEFLNKLAYKESTNTWDTIRYVKKNDKKIPVYVGKYQFGNIAFRDIKSNVRVKDFVKNPNIWPEEQQDIDIYKLFKNNLYYLRKTAFFKGYEYYLGKQIKGIEITKSGVLAAAHLVGYKSLKKFLKSNGETDPEDGNGTKCSQYMNEFRNYKIPF